MKIGLVDVDGHNFPNLALMKLYAAGCAGGGTRCLTKAARDALSDVVKMAEEDHEKN